MKTRTLLFAGALILAVSANPASAQSNATNLPADNPPGIVAPPETNAGPVVMPPTQSPSESAPTLPLTVPATSQPASPTSPTASSLPGPQHDEIYDIRPPLFFLHSWLWLWIALAALSALALLILLASWFHERTKPNPQSAYDVALEKLEKARALMREDDPAPYAVAVSETIRTYLGQRFHAPSARRTTEEFLRQMQSDSATPLAEHRGLLGEFLQSCDLLKFARYHPSATELDQVHQRAFTFVTATKPVAETTSSGGRS
jgi:hypothetical protein